MKSFKLKLAARLDAPLQLGKWERYKRYKNEALTDLKLTKSKLDDEEREFKALIIKNNLSMEELKCVIALARLQAYTTNEIARIFILADI